MRGMGRRITLIWLVAIIFVLIAAPQSEARQGAYTVLLGTHADKTAALAQADRFTQNGLGSVFVRQNAGGRYLVIFGSFEDTKEAMSTVRWLRGYAPEYATLNNGHGPTVIAARASLTEPVQETATNLENKPSKTEPVVSVSSLRTETAVRPSTGSSGGDYYLDTKAMDKAEDGGRYLGDPTVSGKDWTVSLGLEGWWAYTEMDTPDAITSKGKDNTYYPIWGVNLMAGKGNLTLFANYRNGSADFAFTNYSGGTETQYQQDMDFWELEIKGRYLFPKAGNPDRWVPYVTGGLLYVYQDQQYRINTPGGTFLATGTASENHEVSFLSPMVGGGVILPLGSSWGLRAEASLIYTFGTRERLNVVTGWAKQNGDGLGFDTNLAMYWSITPHVGLDLGLDYRYLDGGSEVGQFGRAGVYSTLRYKF